MEIQRRGYSIKAAEAAEAEIYIYGDIGDTYFDGFSARMFAEDMKPLKNVKSITVKINSPGGDVFDGQAIYSLLKKHKARVTVEIDGLAASIASLIAMAGDEIRMSGNAMMMIHNPWTVAAGDAAEMREMADTLEKVQGVIAGVYANRTGLDADHVGEVMAAETWMTAEEAVELGFADAIDEELRLAAYAVTDLGRFKRPPEAVVEAHEKKKDNPTDKPEKPRLTLARQARAKREQTLRRLKI